MYDLHEFLEPIDIMELNDDEAYTDGQIGNNITFYSDELPDVTDADVVFVGINEYRGDNIKSTKHAPDTIRRQLYKLYYWHTDVQIADIGNIKIGAELNDSYAAVKTVLAELLRLNKTVILLGGSHDITLAQYFSYKELEQIIEATVIDASIDLSSEARERSRNFLMEMLTSEPNLVKHYNHVGFQSYFVHPRMLETIDKLRFDCYRVGVAKEHIEEMEPVLRNTNF